jgi:hypothetical protein
MNVRSCTLFRTKTKRLQNGLRVGKNLATSPVVLRTLDAHLLYGHRVNALRNNPDAAGHTTGPCTSPRTCGWVHLSLASVRVLWKALG